MVRINPRRVLVAVFLFVAGSGIVTGQSSVGERLARAKSIKCVFAALNDNVRCVVLNACFSAPHAQAIAKEIDCVVGTTRDISDEAAIQFAAGFSGMRISSGASMSVEKFTIGTFAATPS